MLTHWFKQCRLALLVFLLLLPACLVYAAPDIMPVDDIKPGMKGIGKTVVTGTVPEEFGVEILGVLKNQGPAGDLLLVRTYGDVIDRTGGIAEGMSGSPVYIDGKLVGAIAYGWALADHRIGMVTPIADMLKIWDLPDKWSTANDAGVPGFEETATPLMAAGFTENALTMLKEKLQPFHMVPYAVGEAPEGATSSTVEPGSAVGVQLVRGDISLGALGTVTYVDGDKILAFGHPFLKKGNVNYLMSNAYIFTTVNSLQNSFKVGTVGDPIGTVNQDRGAGIGGRLNYYPSIIPLRITVTDNNIGRRQEAGIQVVDDEQLAPILSATALYNIIDKTMDRVGPGTAKVSFQITARNMPGEVLKRDNMFYSPANIGENCVGEFLEAMTMLAGNQFNPVDIMDVKVNVSVEDDRRTAAIVEARAKTATAKPGDKVDIAVTLKPFRGDSFTQTVTYTVPKEQPAGPLTLEVRGGGMVPLMQLLLKKQGLDGDLLSPEKKGKNTFGKVLQNFAQRDRNNDVVVEVLNIPALADGADKETKKKKDATAMESEQLQTEYAPGKSLAGATRTVLGDKAKDKNHATTDYIIEGDTQVLINVVKDKAR